MLRRRSIPTRPVFIAANKQPCPIALARHHKRKADRLAILWLALMFAAAFTALFVGANWQRHTNYSPEMRKDMARLVSVSLTR